MKEIKSPLKAIRANCIDCIGSIYDIAGCTSYDCKLYPFRFGKNPYIKREITEEQRLAVAERLAKYRKRG